MIELLTEGLLYLNVELVVAVEQHTVFKDGKRVRGSRIFLNDRNKTEFIVLDPPEKIVEKIRSAPFG